jgi:hypothetical protein
MLSPLSGDMSALGVSRVLRSHGTLGTEPTQWEGGSGFDNITLITAYDVTESHCIISGTSPAAYYVFLIGRDASDNSYYASGAVTGGAFSIDMDYPVEVVQAWNKLDLTVWGSPTLDPTGADWDGEAYSQIDTSSFSGDEYYWP